MTDRSSSHAQNEGPGGCMPWEEATGWHDAGRAAFWAFERLSEAKTISEQGDAFNDLSNAMSDLVSWLPGWDWERGVLNDPDALDETERRTDD